MRSARGLAVLLAAVLTGCAAPAGRSQSPSAATPGPTAADAGCPRPSDQHGPLYYAVSGAFVRIQADPGGGRRVVLKRSPASPEEYLRATDAVLGQLGSVQPGSPLTLVSYRSSSMSGSGADPPFSCVER